MARTSSNSSSSSSSSSSGEQDEEEPDKASTSTSSSSASTDFLDALLHHMSLRGPVFPLPDAASVTILSTPAEFLAALTSGIQGAQRRVVLASLYVGTGAAEQDLVRALARAVAARPGLRATLLFDALRSTRPVAGGGGGTGPDGTTTAFRSSAHMLRRLLPLESERVGVWLYHTPLLAGAMARAAPARVNEAAGVCHIKAYAFDDAVLVSGANLSRTYFEDRQDRYVLVHGCAGLADWTARLVDVVAGFSYGLRPDGEEGEEGEELWLPPGREDPVRRPEEFCAAMADAVRREMGVVLDSTSPAAAEADKDGGGGRTDDGRRTAAADDQTPPTPTTTTATTTVTWVCPTVQMGYLGIHQDEASLLWLLRRLPPRSRVHVASAYFNLTPALSDALLARADADVHVLTAAPEAHGFHGAAGASGLVPRLYSWYEQQFYARARRAAAAAGSRSRLRLLEYRGPRPGWSFHAKGAWCALPLSPPVPEPADDADADAADLPVSVTVVGSSNLGHRSRHRDLEAQLVLVTRDPGLRAGFRAERDALFAAPGVEEVTEGTFARPGRRAGWVVRALAKLLKNWL